VYSYNIVTESVGSFELDFLWGNISAFLNHFLTARLSPVMSDCQMSHDMWHAYGISQVKTSK